MSRNDLRGPWGIAMAASTLAAFHFVVEGRACVRAGSQSVELGAGELAVLVHGRGHRIADAFSRAAVPWEELPARRVSDAVFELELGKTGPRTLVLCGIMQLDPRDHPLLALMPDLLVPRGESLAPTFEAIAIEAKRSSPGGEATLGRLIEAAVLQAVRAWLEQSGPTRRGILAALRDPHIARAVARMHREVERPWTTASLAREAHMSRTAFAERFAVLMGAPPIAYLTEWRMQLAARWLREGEIGLGEIAARLGYGSDSAFSRAFKRHAGVAPSALRDRSRASQAPEVKIERAHG